MADRKPAASRGTRTTTQSKGPAEPEGEPTPEVDAGPAADDAAAAQEPVAEEVAAPEESPAEDAAAAQEPAEVAQEEPAGVVAEHDKPSGSAVRRDEHLDGKTRDAGGNPVHEGLLDGVDVHGDRSRSAAAPPSVPHGR